MNALLDADLLQLVGLVLIAAVMLQALLWLAGSLRQNTYQRRQQQLALELLRHQVDTARTRHTQADEERQSWQGHRKFVVTKIEREALDIVSLNLKPHDERRLPGFRPGQHLTFKFNIPGERKMVNRCYSLSDGPLPEHYRITVKRVPPPSGKEAPPGRSSNYINDVIKEGDILDVKAPKGDFFLDLSQRTPVVLVGGGIGITPFISMLAALSAQGFQREVWLFYGVRTSADYVFKSYLEQLAKKHNSFRLHVVYSGIDPADLPAGDNYHHGHVSLELLRQVLPSNNFTFYVCGPPAMMNSLVPALLDWGVARSRIHFEAFGPASIKGFEPVKKAPLTTAAATQAPFNITFSRSGKTLAWNPGFDSLLAFGTANGIAMDSGCSAGECLTCEIALKSGNVHYVKEPSEAPDTGNCLPCVCVPQSDLEIDA